MLFLHGDWYISRKRVMQKRHYSSNVILAYHMRTHNSNNVVLALKNFFIYRPIALIFIYVIDPDEKWRLHYLHAKTT